MTKRADILIITPHPDDAEFGVAGSVVHWIAEGKEVVYVVCTNGDKGTSDFNVKPEDLAETRAKEQRAAASVLGVREVVFLKHPDQGLEDTPEFRKEIVKLIRLYRPETVVTSDPYRRFFWHRDHRITGQVVLDAIFPYARDHLAYPDLLAANLMPHKVLEVLVWGSEEQNYCLDITDSFETKLKALGCHKSQLGDAISPQMRQRLEERAKNIARNENFELGEGFYRAIAWH